MTGIDVIGLTAERAMGLLRAGECTAEELAQAYLDRIAVVEAMKMEHVLHASRDGTIAKVAATEGAQVNQGALIASLAEA